MPARVAGTGALSNGPLPTLEPAAESVAFTAPSVTEIEIPTEFKLEGNYPNPFNPTTQIRFAVPTASDVSLVVYDIMGRQVQQLVEGTMAAGWHNVSFEARHLESGTYLYRLTTGA